MKYNFLISAIGGEIGCNCARLLKEEYPNSLVFGLDLSEENIGMGYVDKVIKVPVASDINYLKVVEEIIELHDIDVFIPTSEQELKTIAISDDFQYNSKTLCLNRDEILTFLDKKRTYDFLVEKSINAPLSIDFNHDYDKGFPVIVKAKEGRGSQQVHLIHNFNELKEMNLDASYMIQEYINGDDEEYTCGVYKCKNNDILTMILKRKLVGGSTGVAEVVSDKKIEEYLHKIGSNLISSGPFNVQLRVSKTKGPLCFEINPRVSSTVAMRHILGFKDFIWSVQEFFGKKISYTPDDKFIGRKLVKVPLPLLVKE